MSRAVVVAHGEVDDADRTQLDGATIVIAVDGGALHLRAWRRAPDLLLGDLDSIDPILRAELADGGVSVEAWPAEKDASDLELAIARALRDDVTEVVVLGALGGTRTDHELANVLLLADAALRGQDVRLVRGTTTVRAIHGPGTLALVGPRVTLLPVAGDVSGITTIGLRYPLEKGTLSFGRSRGLSNQVDGPDPRVRCERGVLLVIESRGG